MDFTGNQNIRTLGEVLSQVRNLKVKNKRSNAPKAVESYTPALVARLVHLSKPANTREGAITDKTGGCNSKASTVERTFT
jgi:hypothetical protein